MRGRPGKARAALSSPERHCGCIRLKRPSQAILATVRKTCARKRLTGNLAPGSGAFDNALTLHVGYLRQHRQDQLASALSHHPQALHVNSHALAQQKPDDGLDPLLPSLPCAFEDFFSSMRLG